jgi:hypothetical protein
MTLWYVDIMWALMLLGVALWTSGCVVFNRALYQMRLMGVIVAYGIGAWMLFALPWKVAVVTWCVFATFGGTLAFAYELWARYRYAGTGRVNRPLLLLRGFVLWPALIPDALEGMLVDAGILPASPVQRLDSSVPTG